ncbi:MAG: glycosyltransferase [Deltaproteobacteria bacterium]|nr:glycosyltransferase [Deltaproteobacteria bacterium]
MFRLIQRLKRDFSISIVSLNAPPLNEEQNKQAAKTLQDMGVECNLVPFDSSFKPHLKDPLPQAFKSLQSNRMSLLLNKLLSPGNFDLLQLEYSASGQWIRSLPRVPVALTLHQLEYLASFRAAMASAKFSARLLGILDTLKALSAEKQSMLKADVLISPTPSEARLCRLISGKPAVVAPMAADPVQSERGKRDFDIVFHGNFSHPANQDAAKILLDQVLPAVRLQRPGTSMGLLGTFMGQALKKKAYHAGISPLGRVSDLHGMLLKARIFVAPLFLGGGMRGKILDALSAGLPVVTTPLGAEGISDQSTTSSKTGTNFDTPVLVVKDKEQFAQKILCLLDDPAILGRLSKEARSLAGHFRWDKTARVYSAMYLGLLKQNY